MVNNLRTEEVKWLTYLVYFLLAVLTFTTGYTRLCVADLEAKVDNIPKEYVTQKQYDIDHADLKTLLKELNLKMDNHMLWLLENYRPCPKKERG